MAPGISLAKRNILEHARGRGSVTPYRTAFIVAAVLALLAIGSALTINDADAANTMPSGARALRRTARTTSAVAVPDEVAA